MKNQLILKNNLKKVRNDKNMSQEDLARLVGTSRQTIIAIEKRDYNPSVSLSMLISIALDSKVEDLFYFE